MIESLFIVLARGVVGRDDDQIKQSVAEARAIFSKRYGLNCFARVPVMRKQWVPQILLDQVEIAT
jgi:hypothetical protein